MLFCIERLRNKHKRISRLTVVHTQLQERATCDLLVQNLSIPQPAHKPLQLLVVLRVEYYPHSTCHLPHHLYLRLDYVVLECVPCLGWNVVHCYSLLLYPQVTFSAETTLANVHDETRLASRQRHLYLLLQQRIKLHRTVCQHCRPITLRIRTLY